ncbi:MAG TPA: capsular biosynthesis protein [Chitinophagaceae bacterium]|nr:capsular biosynthesis protein [Chitinophagaceae bacterium]
MQPKPQPQKNPFQKDENLITQMISRYISFWPLFLIAGILSIGAAYTYLRYATPLYEATATLIIKDEKKGNDDSKFMESLNMISTKKIIENEVEVLQSRSLMDRVVKSLSLYAPVFQEGKIRAVSAYLSCPLKIEIYNPDDLVEVPKVHLKYDEASKEVYLDGKKAGTINEWLNTPYGRLRFTPNPKYKGNPLGKPFYFSLVDVRTITRNKLKSLKVVAASKLSSIINLSYRDDVPARAEDVLNELIKYYDRAAIDEKNSLAKNTLEFVEDRLNLVGQDIDSMTKIVTRYKSSQGASDISTQGQLYLQNVSSNDQRLGEINMQLAAINQAERTLTMGGGTASLPSTLGSSDPSLASMMNNLNTAEIEYEKLRKTVAENNPMLVSLRDQINKLRPTILENIQNQKQSLEASKTTIANTNSKYNSMLSRIPVKERELVDMSRDLNIKNGIYQFLLQKKEESELSYASTLSDSRVVNKAQSTRKPVSPNKMLIYLAAMAAAMGLSILFISAREAFSRKVLYRNEVESLTSVPIIGEVAFNKSNEHLVIEAGKRSFIAEEFRKIRVSLHFLGINFDTKKKLLVTSSIPGEGKSFVAANLAISHSLTGKKVVLVDVDLHNPGLGKIFGKTTEDPGVSDFLAGKKKPEDIIKRVPEHENLYYVSSGFLHDSPSELLLNGKIQELITYLEGIFDLIIMDTAPVVLVTDAYILSPLSNVTIYVVRHKYTPKMLVKRIDENNKINPLVNPAIVFNGVKTRGFFKNNYGYGYDYVYGDKRLKNGKTVRQKGAKKKEKTKA